MTDKDAKKILLNFAPQPKGMCFVNNEINIEYDLQVIIPAYNVEKYIGECLQSVLSQKTKYNVLVTIINDGSTDNTAQIINEVINNYSGNMKLELITQKNRGLSEARNAALKTIKGEFITFLDSDDLLLDMGIEKLIDNAYSYDLDIIQGNWLEFKTFSNDKRCVSANGFSGFPWGKLYRSTVFKKFQFPEGYWFEDTPISFIITGMNYKFKNIPNYVYAYRLNPEGITAKAHLSKKQ